MCKPPFHRDRPVDCDQEVITLQLAPGRYAAWVRGSSCFDDALGESKSTCDQHPEASCIASAQEAFCQVASGFWDKSAHLAGAPEVGTAIPQHAQVDIMLQV